MADAKQDQKRDGVDEAMLRLAKGRVVLGVAAFTVPGLTVRLMGMGRGADPGRDFVTRMFAAREIALGAGYLLSKESDRRLWARLGLLVDGLDTAGAVRSRGGLPLWITASATAVAGGCTALGAAKVTRDLVS